MEPISGDVFLQPHSPVRTGTGMAQAELDLTSVVVLPRVFRRESEGRELRVCASARE